MAGMIKSPQLRESPETTKCHSALLVEGTAASRAADELAAEPAEGPCESAGRANTENRSAENGPMVRLI